MRCFSTVSGNIMLWVYCTLINLHNYVFSALTLMVFAIGRTSGHLISTEIAPAVLESFLEKHWGYLEQRKLAH